MSKTKILSVLITLLILTGIGSVVHRGLYDPIIESRVKEAEVELGLIAKSISTSYDKHGHLPDEGEWLELLLDDNLIKRLPKDPWGKPYTYRLINDDSFILLSTGSLLLGPKAVLVIFVKSDMSFIERSLVSNET